MVKTLLLVPALPVLMVSLMRPLVRKPLVRLADLCLPMGLSGEGMDPIKSLNDPPLLLGLKEARVSETWENSTFPPADIGEPFSAS